MSRAGKPITLALTPPLLAWLRQDPSWSSLPWAWRAAQRWRAAWSGLNARQSEALANPAIPLQDPVFIVGPWRSGTTVMHELLTAATGCATPLTWQCMNAPAFRLASRPPNHVAIARPMDGLTIGALSPQEDEFALLSLGADSAYRGFLMPHRLPELHHTLDPKYWLADDAWLAVLTSFLDGVLKTSQGPQPLILKSPNHSFRIPALLKRFPGARFIWMARDPVEVLHSNRKMWSAMFEAHGLSAADPGQLDDFLALALERSAQVLLHCQTQLPSSQLLVCPHVSLLQSPAEVVARIGKRLQLPMSNDLKALQQALASTQAGRVERYVPSLPARLQPAVDALSRAQQQAQATHGLD